jgi:hypothetical protein
MIITSYYFLGTGREAALNMWSALTQKIATTISDDYVAQFYYWACRNSETAIPIYIGNVYI